MDYARLPAMVQFALVDVEAHTHLERAEQAARMWRTVAAELRELSDALAHELDCLRPQWQDATGAGFAHQVTRRKAAIDEMLTRIMANEPWRALDDLARQLLLTRGKVTETVERQTDAGHEEAAVHLTELDRYFLAAAEAVLGAAGGERPPGQVATDDALAGDCCAEPGAADLLLAGDPALTAAPQAGGSSLPPGSVSMPGLVAVPMGGLAGRRNAPRAAGSSEGRSFDPRSAAGGSLGDDPRGGSGSSLRDDPRALPGGSDGPDLPARIERAANPVPLTEAQAAPEAPQPPEQQAGTKPGSQGVPGGMVPPMMMMPPMIPGTARSTTGRRGAGSATGTERRTRGPQATPGVPARLRGRSALGDPAAVGYRPVAMSGRKNSPAEPETLDHEVWQVANPVAASPLKPETTEPEPPRRLRRPRA